MELANIHFQDCSIEFKELEGQDVLISSSQKLKILEVMMFFFTFKRGLTNIEKSFSKNSYKGKYKIVLENNCRVNLLSLRCACSHS